MGSWKKHFQIVPTKRMSVPSQDSGNGIGASSGKYASWLPEVYSGQGNRLERYTQYNQMDLDTEVSASLDIISDFCSQTEEDTGGLPFQIVYQEDVTEIEMNLLETAMKQWCKLNLFKRNLWGIVRRVIKYGDQFFLRDPETYEWFWIDHTKVASILAAEHKGKEPEFYQIKDLNINLQTKVATQRKTTGIPGTYPSAWPQQGDQPGSALVSNIGGRFAQDPNTTPIEAKYIVHISLSDGMDDNWPFGNSLLEPVFKTFKQKEMIEDAMLIYRVQRAPERRVFYIDVGNMPTHKANAFLERVKMEIHQKRIPNRTGGGSSLMDAAYNPMCISTLTAIPLLDGRTLTLAELIAEYQSGKENWAYSCDPVTGKIVPGLITWAGITRRNARVIKLTFDNGKTLTCTPDHKIPVLGKGFVEAQHLQVGTDSLVSFETRYRNVDRRVTNERTYQQVYDHQENKWKFTHRVVGEFFRGLRKHQEFTFLTENTGAKKDTIHHKDYNRYNNDPQNLQWMNRDDHVAWHVHQKQDYWNNLSPDERERITNKISTSLKKYWETKTDEERKEYSEKKGEMFRQIIQDMKDNDPQKFSKWRKNLGERRRQYLNNNPEVKEALGKKLSANGHRFKNQELVFTREMLSRMVTIVKNNDSNRLQTLSLLPNDEEFMNLYRSANTRDDGDHNKSNINPDQISDKCLKKMLANFGYKNWKDFKAKVPVYNHKVTSIEWVDDHQDVGTITVDGEEKYHSYHTFAIENGIFIRNSILEDYFLAQSSDGRGSKVETLPGGDGISSVEDLMYFNNKLKRGLGVPSSYLPSGNEEGSQAYSDGRVGTAYIQEYRFSKYCQRLQNMIVTVFNQEFKLYVKRKGITIPDAMYDLEFNPPQNFSKFRQIELDSAHIQIFSQLVQIPWIARRTLAERYLGWSEDEIVDNEGRWKEENPGKLKSKIGRTAADEASGGLRDVGISGGPDPLAGMDGGGNDGVDGGDDSGGDGSAPPDAGGPPDMAGGPPGGMPGGDMGGGMPGGGGPPGLA